MANGRTRLDYLADATAGELMEELARRRKEALGACSDEEIETELRKRPGGHDLADRLPPTDYPPRRVEK
mgnify:CR=1 FL=1